MRIGELAEVTGTSIETIRYYERVGLLAPPERTEGNFRIYTHAHAERLSFIRHCRSLDMTLDEIRALLRFKDVPTENCGEVNMLVDEHIGHGAARISELRALETQLKTCVSGAARYGRRAHCGILKALSKTSKGVRQPRQPAQGCGSVVCEQLSGQRSVSFRPAAAPTNSQQIPGRPRVMSGAPA